VSVAITLRSIPN